MALLKLLKIYFCQIDTKEYKATHTNFKTLIVFKYVLEEKHTKNINYLWERLQSVSGTLLSQCQTV